MRRRIDEIDTQPLLALEALQKRRQKPTLAQLRQRAGMTQFEVARAANVRFCRVNWIERGIGSPWLDVNRVLFVLSRKLGQTYRVEDIIGVKIQAQNNLWVWSIG